MRSGQVVLSLGLMLFCAWSIAAQTPVPSPPTPPNPAPIPNPQQQQQQRPQNEIERNTVPQTQTQRQQTNPPTQTPTQQQIQVPPTTQPLPPGGTTPTTPNVTTQTPSRNVGTSGGIAPAQLPDDPPPIAPNFEAAPRPLPSAARVGVDTSDQLPITLQEAITLTLQNNKGAAGVSSFSPVAGGSYTADFSSSRLVTNKQNATLNLQFPSAFTLTYTQPLWRGLRFDNNRRTIEIAKKNLSLTDAQFRQRAVEVIAQVGQAYWDLAFSLRNLQVQIDAVKQARLQLESNQRLVSKGVLAPIAIVAANTQITTFEQNVYTAQESVTRAENLLKTLMLPDRTTDVWNRALVPVSPIDLKVPNIPLEQSVSAALTNRQELTQLQANSEINKIDERYFRDLTKPQIDLVGSFTSSGLAGNPVPRFANTGNPALTTRVNQLSALNNLPPLETTTTATSTIPPNLVGGNFKSLSNLLTADYPTYRVGVRISLPFGNKVAKANLGRTLTVFLVLQRQNEPVAARGRELQAQTNLNKAISEFRRATGTTLSANSVEITNGTSTSRFIFRRPVDFGSRIFRAKN